jgi:hypothetical protein
VLEAWRIPARQIGFDWGKKGLQDNEIVIALRRLNKATLFTRDVGFYRPEVRHLAYCIVVMKVGPNETAQFVRRFLKHPDFNSRAKRMGQIVRLSAASIASWRIHDQHEAHIEWKL